jgi:hypothetical protein
VQTTAPSERANKRMKETKRKLQLKVHLGYGIWHCLSVQNTITVADKTEPVVVETKMQRLQQLQQLTCSHSSFAAAALPLFGSWQATCNKHICRK